MLTAIPLFIYVTVIQGMAIGSAGPVPGTGPEMVVALATVAVVLADAFQPAFYLAVSGRQVICLRVEKNGYRPEHLVFAAPLPEVTVAARRRGLVGSRVRISVAGRRQRTLWLAGNGILGRQSAEVIAALQAGGAAVAGRSG